MFGRRLALGFAIAAALATAIPAQAGFFKDLVDNMQLEDGPLGNLGNGSAAARRWRRAEPQPQPHPRRLVLSRAGQPQPHRAAPVPPAGGPTTRRSEKPGTIIINSRQHFLYYVLGDGKAVRYGIGVGREGFGWKGTVSVGRKAEWPTWTPPPEMVAREKARGRILPASMKGGPNNPLGARALYLYRGGNDTMYRIHGTSEPWTIGLNVSSGCIRMVNKDVVDLYNRAKVGAAGRRPVRRRV